MSHNRRRKNKSYGNYDKLKRAEIEKRGIYYGIRPGVRKYGVPEYTVRSIIKNYMEAKVEDDGLEELPRKRGSKPLLPSGLHERVLSMIKSMRQTGCAVNYNIVIAIAKAIVLTDDPSLLKENGDSFA